MKYLLVLIIIIGVMTYIFMAGPKVLPGQEGSGLNRREVVWEQIAALEASRRNMLAWAELNNMGMLPPARAARGGPWAQGYKVGFLRGYSVGTAAAVRAFPGDPLAR